MISSRALLDERVAVKSSAPPVANIDLGQLRVLISLTLRQSLRPAITANGRGRRPLPTLVVSMLLIGGMFSTSGRYASDLSSYLIGLFTAVMFVVMTGVIPQTQVLRDRDFELLHSKPVSDATHRVAWIFSRFFYAWLLSTTFAAIPLVRAVISFDAGFALLGGSYLMLLLASFAVVVFWMSMVARLSRLTGLDTYRRIAQSAHVILMLGLMVPSIIAFGGGEFMTFTPVSLSRSPLIKYFPPAWFATFWSGGFDLTSNLERLCSLLLIAAAFVLALSPGASRRYMESMDRLTALDQTKPRTPIAIRVADAIRHLPLLGRLLISDQVFAVLSLVLMSVQREEQSRLRMLSSRLFILVFAIWCYISPDSFIVLLLAGWSFGTVTDGIELLKRCSQPGGAWIFRAAPLADKSLEKGFRLAVLVNYFLAPGILVSVAVFRIQAPLPAGAMVLTYFAMASLLSSVMLIVVPSIPLTQEAAQAPGFWTFIIAWGFNIPAAILYFVLQLLFDLGPVGLAAFAVLFLALCGIGYLLTLWAGSRLSRLEIGV